MSFANFTKDQEYNSYGEQACSPEITEGIHNQLICLSVINSLLSITAFLGNALILIALHKESSLHAPSKLLFRTLTTTDLCVGIIVEPLFMTFWISMVNERWDLCRLAFNVAFTAANILCSMSLLTMTAISVDRLLALLLGLRYRQVVTLKRTYITVTVLWFLPIFGSAMYFLNHHIMLWCINIGLPLCLVISVFSYVKSFLVLHHQQVNSSSKSCSPRTTEPNSGTEHSAIQRDSVQCTVGAVSFNCLLSVNWYSGGFEQSKDGYWTLVPC